MPITSETNGRNRVQTDTKTGQKRNLVRKDGKRQEKTWQWAENTFALFKKLLPFWNKQEAPQTEEIQD